MSSKIEWLHQLGTKAEVWNPVTGCTKVSEGCRHCYAERVAERFWPTQYPTTGEHDESEGVGEYRARRFTDVRTHEDRLDLPLRWRKPRTVFVNSMSDLFHEAVPDEFIRWVISTIVAADSWHAFIILTKRARRMRDFVRGLPLDYVGFPQNVWLGVSVENRAALSRIDDLRATPAFIRVVSFEPLLEDVGTVDLRGLDWIIVGGESGPKARPCDVAWVRSLVRQAKAAGVSCFVKQVGAHVLDRNDAGFEGDKLGSWPMDTRVEDMWTEAEQGAPVRVRLRARKGGDPSEWPADLRVQEWPSERGGGA